MSTNSSEGLARLPWGDKGSIEEYDCSQYLFANRCKECVPDAKSLIWVRSPNIWVRSVYVQMVQEGSNWSFIKFLRMQKNHLILGLNIIRLMKNWSDAYGSENVILYPFEWLVAQPKLANEELYLLLSVPSDKELFVIKTKSNKSLTDNINKPKKHRLLECQLNVRNYPLTVN